MNRGVYYLYQTAEFNNNLVMTEATRPATPERLSPVIMATTRSSRSPAMASGTTSRRITRTASRRAAR